MNEIFSTMYEFGGLLPFYSADLGDHLRGFDETCTDYIGTPWYIFIGFTMIGLTLLTYAILYHFIDHPRYNGKRHWWITTLFLCMVNFLFAFGVAFNSVHSGHICKQLHITTGDVLGFGLANAILAFLFFVIMTSVPWIRRQSTNCKYTTFWQP